MSDLPISILTPEEIAKVRELLARPKVDWSARITPYLPAVRSLVWMAVGLLTGATGGVALTPTPAPVEKVVTTPGPERVITKETVREVPITPGTVKMNEDKK